MSRTFVFAEEYPMNSMFFKQEIDELFRHFLFAACCGYNNAVEIDVAAFFRHEKSEILVFLHAPYGITGINKRKCAAALNHAVLNIIREIRLNKGFLLNKSIGSLLYFRC